MKNRKAHRLIYFLLIMLIFSACGESNTSKIKIYHLRTSDKVNPVGTTGKPYFGWYLDGVKKQSAYQLLIANSKSALAADEGNVFHSGKVESDLQNFVYPDKVLEASQRYYWKVKIWDEAGNESDYSKIAQFDVGLLSNADWSHAKWIKRESNANEDYTYFRKGFALDDQNIERAIVYVSAVHDYELYFNGSLVGKGPGYHYPQYQYYKAYDITSRLNAENIFASLVHWYGGGQGRPRSRRGLILKMVVDYVDGSQFELNTDGTWKQTAAAQFITDQPRRNGEGVGFIDRIDSRNEIRDWNKLDFDDSVWDLAQVIGEHPVEPWVAPLQPNLTQLIEDEIKPADIALLSNGNYLIDLGKIYAGVPQITFSGGETGQVVDILAGYTLNADSTVSTETDQNTDMRYSFILNGENATFEPMVYLGMRYIEVQNAPGELSKSNVQFTARHYDLDMSRSSFTSSNDMLNKVWELMKHSVMIGSQESFVDTPTREKGGFLGDSWSIGAAAMNVAGDRAMNRRILQEFMDSQDQYWPDGRLNAVYPNVDGGRDIPDYTQMYPFWVWDYYLQTGDQQFLSTHFERLQKLAGYIESHIGEETGLVENLSGGGGPYLYGIVDWPAQMRFGHDMETVARTIMNGYAYGDFEVMARISEVLGNSALSKAYHQKAADIKQAINQQLLNEEGVYIDGLDSAGNKSNHASQHANMVPLALGIVPESNEEQVIEWVKAKEMSVGMVTLRWLVHAIGAAEEGEHLIELYTNPRWYGWANIVASGGTATWESWDALTSGESLSHPWGAVGLLGIQQYILGVNILKPQHELISIKPLDFQDRLDSAEGTIPTDRGDIQVSWVKSEIGYDLEVIVPSNITAQVYIPRGNSETNMVIVNGAESSGKFQSNHIYVGEFGAGKHVFSKAL